MLEIILDLDVKETIGRYDILDIQDLIELLKNCTIIDSEGGAWIIDSSSKIYFDTKPPHITLSCRSL